MRITLTAACRTVCALAAVVIGVGSLSAALPIGAVSDQASLVIRLKQPDATIQKVVDFVNQIQPGLGTMVQAQTQGLGVLISNPTLAGVDQKRDWYVAAFARAEGEPGVLFVIPVTDAKAFQEALGDQFKSVAKDKWVVYSDDAATLEAAQKRLSGEGRSIAELIAGKPKEIFDAGDLSVYINVPQLRKVYKKQLDEAGQAIDDFFDKLSQTSVPQPGVDFEAIAELYKQIVSALLQAVRDTNSCTAALTVTRSGLTFDEYALVSPSSPTDRFLQANPPSELKLFARLPAGKPVYAGFFADTARLAQWGTNWYGSVLKDNPEFKKLATAMFQELSKAQFGDMVSCFWFGTVATGVIRSATISEVKPTSVVRNMTDSMMELMPKMETPGIKYEVEAKRDAEKYGKYSADVHRVKLAIDQEADPTGTAKAIIDAVYGPEGLTTRTIYLPDKVVQVVGGGKETAMEVLESLENPKSGTPTEYMALRQQLLPKANVLVLIDLPGSIFQVFKLIVDSGKLPIPVKPDMLDGLQISPSYMGFSVATEPQGVRAKTVIPTKQFQNIMQLVTFAQQVFMRVQMQQQQGQF
ncbi:MAG TPA: hypothetical protein EYP14_17145 [Planctomycetaceae bacterium]|nr:hypothetical protein [Planctomycetaceae bacterium]